MPDLLHVFTRATRPIRTVAKAAIFFLKAFPMLPSGPVDWVTKPPVIEKVRYPTRFGQAEGDLYRPSAGGPHPGTLVCLGVVPFGVDHPQVPVLGKPWHVLDPVKGKLPLFRLVRELGKFFLAVYPLFRQAVAA